MSNHPQKYGSRVLYNVKYKHFLNGEWYIFQKIFMRNAIKTRTSRDGYTLYKIIKFGDEGILYQLIENTSCEY